MIDLQCGQPAALALGMVQGVADAEHEVEARVVEMVGQLAVIVGVHLYYYSVVGIAATGGRITSGRRSS